MRSAQLFGIAIALMVFAGPSQSQALKIDVTGLESSCAQGANTCAIVTDGHIGALKPLGFGPEEFNQQLGILASTLVDVARSLSPDYCIDIKEALDLVGDASTDPEQQAMIYQIAVLVGNCRAAEIDTSDPTNPSPA